MVYALPPAVQYIGYSRQCLVPILFLMYIIDVYSSSNLPNFMFADDIACVASDTNLDNLANNVNDELKGVARWFRAN